MTISIISYLGWICKNPSIHTSYHFRHFASKMAILKLQLKNFSEFSLSIALARKNHGYSLDSYEMMKFGLEFDPWRFDLRVWCQLSFSLFNWVVSEPEAIFQFDGKHQSYHDRTKFKHVHKHAFTSILTSPTRPFLSTASQSVRYDQFSQFKVDYVPI